MLLVFLQAKRRERTVGGPNDGQPGDYDTGVLQILTALQLALGHPFNFPVVIPLLNPKERFVVLAKVNIHEPSKLLWHFGCGLSATATGNPYPEDVLLRDFFCFHNG